MIFYDSTQIQKVSLILEGADGEQSNVVHTLAPLSNQRYFQFQLELERLGDAKPSELLKPKFSLWRELCKKREAETGTAGEIDELEAATVINTITAFQTIPATEKIGTVEAYDESEAFTVMFLGVMNNLAFPLGLTFRSVDVPDIDRFFEIRKESNLSDITKSTAEKVYNFGLSMLTKSEGYKNSETIPAWHIIGAIADVMSGYDNFILR